MSIEAIISIICSILGVLTTFAIGVIAYMQSRRYTFLSIKHNLLRSIEDEKINFLSNLSGFEITQLLISYSNITIEEKLGSEKIAYFITEFGYIWNIFYRERILKAASYKYIPKSSKEFYKINLKARINFKDLDFDYLINNEQNCKTAIENFYSKLKQYINDLMEVKISAEAEYALLLETVQNVKNINELESMRIAYQRQKNYSNIYIKKFRHKTKSNTAKEQNDGQAEHED